MTEIILSILTAAVTIGLAYSVGRCIASHLDTLNHDEWN